MATSETRELLSYTIRANNKVVKAGDSVLIQSPKNRKDPYVARIRSIKADVQGKVKVDLKWYYRPEDSVAGRRTYYGKNEVFSSDHYDTQDARTILDKCIIHDIKNYTRLNDIGPLDYFHRFEYKTDTGLFLPDYVEVFCKCEMPLNPDDFMLKCQDCKERYHPHCIHMTIDQAKQIDRFTCEDCQP